MARLSRIRGQAMVEVALLMPILIITFAVTVQVIVLCHNHVAMQMIASRLIRRVSSDQKKSLNSPLLYTLLWGRVTPPRAKRSSHLCLPWREFRPVYLMSTIKSPGSWASIEIKSTLSPGITAAGYMAHFPLLSTAEILLEPPVPAEE